MSDVSVERLLFDKRRDIDERGPLHCIERHALFLLLPSTTYYDFCQRLFSEHGIDVIRKGPQPGFTYQGFHILSAEIDEPTFMIEI